MKEDEEEEDSWDIPSQTLVFSFLDILFLVPVHFGKIFRDLGSPGKARAVKAPLLPVPELLGKELLGKEYPNSLELFLSGDAEVGMQMQATLSFVPDSVKPGYGKPGSWNQRL